MKSLINRLSLLLAFGLIVTTGKAQVNNVTNTTKEKVMKTYIIERDIAGAKDLTGEQLKGIAQKSCAVVAGLGSGIEWLHSYVAGDKFYCIYKAESEEIIREHAKIGGFPCNKITEVANIFSPETAK